MVSATTQTRNFKKKALARTRAIIRTAVQDTVTIAQRTEKEAGRMRVDTGFLRASVQAALHGPPRGPTNNPNRVDFRNVNQAAGQPVSVTLLQWDPNGPVPIYVGWTANYARLRESKDGFLRGALEKWDVTVANAARKVGNV